MKSINVLCVVAAMSVSGLVMAEGGAERTVARAEQARQVSLQAYAVAKQQQTPTPVVETRAKPTKHANC